MNPTEIDYSNPEAIERELTARELLRGGCPRRHVERRDLQREGIGEAWAAAMAKAGNIFRRPGSIVALLGPRGCGKTQLSIELLRAAVRRRGRVRYGTLNAFASAMRDGMHSGSGEAKTLAAWTAPGWLVLDELQDGANSDFERRALSVLIDSRYGDVKRTILIGNFDPDAFQTFAGDSITSRMNETGGILEVRGPSFRENPAE